MYSINSENQGFSKPIKINTIEHQSRYLINIILKFNFSYRIKGTKYFFKKKVYNKLKYTLSPKRLNIVFIIYEYRFKVIKNMFQNGSVFLCQKSIHICMGMEEISSWFR